MNVWITLTRKRSKCFYCGRMIETGDYQVVCQYYMKQLNSERTWVRKMRFHAKEPYCWIDRGLVELSTRPAIAEHRGRHQLSMSDEVRAKRLKIQRRRASVKQRLEIELSKLLPDADKVVHLVEVLNKYVEEIEGLGGVPEGWVNKEGGN